MKKPPVRRVLVRRVLARSLALFFAGVSVWLSASPMRAAKAAEDAAARQAAKRRAYADSARQGYIFVSPGAAEAVYANGKLSLPGNAAIAGDDFIQPAAFPTAQYCGHCHQEAYHQWRQALHSNSFRTPFYRTSVNLLLREKGIRFTRHCDSCHNPIAVLSGSLNENARGDRSFDSDGLTCTVCHSIQKVDSKLGNGSYTLAVPSALVDAQGKRIPGMVPDAEILAHPDRHDKAVMQPIYQSTEFCSACHKANVPVMLNDYKWIRAFSTYDEWQGSKYSRQNPLVFYTATLKTCQGCHMPRANITLRDPGAKHGQLASHRWLAGNTAVPFYYGFDEQLKKTEEFLETGDFLNLDIFGLRVVKPLGQGAESEDAAPLIGPLGLVPFTIAAQDTIEADVVVQSKFIGHSLIPELRDLYEAWVKFTVTDGAGNTIYQSGFLRPDGTLEPGAHSFTNRPVNAEGTFVDNHKIWTIHSVAYDNSIQSGRSALIRYRFQLPAHVNGPIRIKAAVEYRHLRQTYLNNVLGADHAAYPVVEMAARSRTIYVGRNQPTAALANDNPEWMRWNNLGIGYLDQLQYAEAGHAFAQVVRLFPDYKDGYINIGLNLIEWEKYAEARAPLEKALALAPHDARALYYMALVERRSRHPEAEIADLNEVVEQYPMARDALRELGIAYYQQHRPQDAVTAFRRLQAVDPDDLAAHYNLAILYRRLGMKQEAAKESAQYAMKWIDPAAPTYSLEYLRAHPEISKESVPWHVHAEATSAMHARAEQP